MLFEVLFRIQSENSFYHAFQFQLVVMDLDLVIINLYFS